MRVLIGAGNYPKLSESYIEAEIKFLLRSGVDVAVYSPVCGSPEAPEIVRVFRDIGTAIREHNPNVFHVHYLTFDWNAMEAAGRLNIPVTIRGHSFDFSVNVARNLANRATVKKIWLFPHFAELVGHPKISPLPVAYDSTLYKPSEKDVKIVYRTGAGKHGKGLVDFFEVAKLCPGFKFGLSANIVLGEEPYLGVLAGYGETAPVEYVTNIQRDEAVLRMSVAGIYLDTSDPKSHAFGMPISIAEAMATGAYVLARKNDTILGYMGEAGAIYESVDHAAALILETSAWSSDKWTQVRQKAIQRAQDFKDDVVLQAELECWSGLCS